MIETLFQELGFSEISATIYQHLFQHGSLSARQLALQLDLPRPTVYDNLETLINAGLVTAKEENGKKFFGLEEVKNLKRILQAKIASLRKNEMDLQELLAQAETKRPLEPKTKFYSGANGIRQVLKDMLWYDNIETVTMWPISEMVELLGRDYLEDLNRRRIRQHISIRGIWPRDKAIDFKEHPYLGVGSGHLRELRWAPKGMVWHMSYWLYADKVACISSKAEGFGLLIHSRDFAQLIKVQFEEIWKHGVAIKPRPEYTDQFLKTI